MDITTFETAENAATQRMNSPGTPWSIHEAMGQLAAALPDAALGQRYGIPRNVLERVSAAYVAMELASLSEHEAIDTLEQGCAYLAAAWLHLGGPPAELVTELSRAIAHFRAPPLAQSTGHSTIVDNEDGPSP